MPDLGEVVVVPAIAAGDRAPASAPEAFFGAASPRGVEMPALSAQSPSLETTEAGVQRRTLAALIHLVLPTDRTAGAAETGVVEYVAQCFAEKRFEPLRPRIAKCLDLLEESAQDSFHNSFAACGHR